MEFEDRSQSCTCTLFLPHWVEIELIFALRTAVFEIRADFQNFRIRAWNLELEDRSHSCISTLFLPQREKLSLFLLYWQPFRDTCRFSKFPYLGMESGIWKQIPKLHMYFLSTPGVQIKLIFALRKTVFEIRTIFKISMFGHEIWNL